MRIRFLGWDDPYNRKWKPTPVFLPAKFHGQRSSAGPVHGSQGQPWLRVPFVHLGHVGFTAVACGSVVATLRLYSTGSVVVARGLRCFAHVASSWTRDRTCVSALAGGSFTTEPPGKP